MESATIGTDTTTHRACSRMLKDETCRDYMIDSPSWNIMTWAMIARVTLRF